MSRSCERCGSYAINPGHHGRTPGEDLHLCDVCFWRSRAEKAEAEAGRLRGLLERMPNCSLLFRNQAERDTWNRWQDEAFTPDGEVRKEADT